MNKYIASFFAIIVALLLAGCAGLIDVVAELPGTDATAEIGAIDVLTEDFIKDPVQSSLAIGIGYILCLLRRWYKKKKGMQN